MNPEYTTGVGYECSNCANAYLDYKSAADCCLPKITLRFKPTGQTKEFAFGIKKLGYSNELVICDTFGYDNGKPTDKNNPQNWEIVSIEGFNSR